MSRIIAVLLLILFICPLHLLSQQTDGAMEIDGTQRTFHLFTPDHLPESKKYPLVIMLHGGGGTGSQMSRFTHFNDWAEKDSFIVCYPDGWKRQWNDHRIGSDLPFEKMT